MNKTLRKHIFSYVVIFLFFFGHRRLWYNRLPRSNISSRTTEFCGFFQRHRKVDRLHSQGVTTSSGQVGISRWNGHSQHSRTKTSPAQWYPTLFPLPGRRLSTRSSCCDLQVLCLKSVRGRRQSRCQNTSW